MASLQRARHGRAAGVKIVGAQVVLASATPSLESWVNAESGATTGSTCPRATASPNCPRCGPSTCGRKRCRRALDLARTANEAIDARLQAGEQSLLFLNRRGYAPVTVCRGCGHQIQCADCDARMVEHRFLNRLMCHQCGATAPVPECLPFLRRGRAHGTPSAPASSGWRKRRARLFPEARVAVLSSDLFASARALKAQIDAIAAGDAEIVIGTQLVAKGHNFPLLTLVGVIDADLGLHGSDLRAAERTFQLIRQVAGRAGRADRSRAWRCCRPISRTTR
jgi:primosomal protein N' (replication factor Y) (superfamily II helicase)